MAYTDGSIGLAVAQRIVEMFSFSRASWPQRLWRASSIDSLRHCIDLIDGGARDGAKGYAIKEARRSIEVDLFIPGRDRGGILKALAVAPERMRAGSTVDAKLRSLTAELERQYPSWVQAHVAEVDDTVTVANSHVDGNKLSWQLAAFFRSAGMSDSWIRNFHNYHLHHNPDVISLAESTRLACNSIASPSGWTFFIPLVGRRSFNVSAAPLLGRREFEERFQIDLPEVPVPNNRGGLVISVDVTDKHAAIEHVELEIQRVLERYRASGTKRRMVLDTFAWVTPGSWKTAISAEAEPRIVVRSLDAFGGRDMFGRASDELEAALDLLTAADRTSHRAATIAAWAVLETLFADESDFGELAAIADKAADILTCLYVQSTFGDLALGHARAGTDTLSVELREADSAAAALLTEAELPSHPLSVNATVGELARQRAAKMSVGEVRSVRSQIAAVLRRLYDIRNQIVHAGRMAPFGLDRTYEESTVLLSALMDELIKQHRSTNRSAREVAGRASWLLERVESDRATPASLAAISSA